MPSATRRLQLLALLSFCHYSSCFNAVSLKPALSSSTGTFYNHSPPSPRAKAAIAAASSSRFPFGLNAHRQLQQPRNKNSNNNNHSDSDGDKTIQHDASFLALLNRRHFLATATAVMSSSSLFIPTLPAHAGALLQFPVGPETQVLKNKYHFMRAGLSDLEEQGIYSTNALFLTNRENAMNVEKGEAMVLQALEIIKRSNPQLYPTVTYHSLAANGMDTGDLIARELKLGREKLLPEFTYLDQRGVGLWDAGDESIVKPAIWALDYAEAGKFGIAEKSRPPANNDGTPNETLGDQFVRLRQFLSLQESRTSGETILVIFPDGTGPALLSCMIAGIPFRDVHALEYRPGEVRLDITPESVRALFETRKDDPEYLAILEDGKEKLVLLRQQQKESPSTFVGLKEQMAEKERLEIDEAFETKKRTDATREMERQRAIQEAREEKSKKQRQLQEEKERERNERASANAAAALAAKSTSSNEAKAVSTSSSRSLELGSSSIMAAAAVGVLGLGMVAMSASGRNDSEKENDKAVAVPKTVDMETNTTSVANVKEEEKSASLPPPATRTTETKSLLYAKTITPLIARSPRDEEEQAPAPTLLNGATTNNDESRSSTTPSRYSLTDEDVVDESSILVDSDVVIQEQLDQLVAAEQAMKDALTGAASSSSNSNSNNNVEFVDSSDTYEEDDAWLRVLADIRDEEDDNEFLNDDAKTAADFDLIIINGDGRKQGPSTRSADL